MVLQSTQDFLSGENSNFVIVTSLKDRLIYRIRFHLHENLSTSVHGIVNVTIEYTSIYTLFSSWGRKKFWINFSAIFTKHFAIFIFKEPILLQQITNDKFRTHNFFIQMTCIYSSAKFLRTFQTLEYNPPITRLISSVLNGNRVKRNQDSVMETFVLYEGGPSLWSNNIWKRVVGELLQFLQ